MSRRNQRVLKKVEQRAPWQGTDGMDFETAVAAELRSYEEAVYLVSVQSDTIRLGEVGWHERYYHQKAGLAEGGSIAECSQAMCLAYLEGIEWTMGYYYDTTPSWSWFYPYHYAPFASDFVTHAPKLQQGAKLQKGAPWPPLAQLMAVLPPQSSSCLPQAHRRLMRDKTSPLATIYPSDFVEDFNGKQWTWQAVAILPFVDESTLLQVIAELDQMLTPEEKETTKQGRELLGVNMAHPIAQVSINRADMPLPTSLQLAGRVASHEKDIQAGTWLLWYNVPPPEPHLCDLLPQAQLCNPSLTNADLSEAQKAFKHGRNRRQGGRPKVTYKCNIAEDQTNLVSAAIQGNVWGGWGAEVKTLEAPPVSRPSSMKPSEVEQYRQPVSINTGNINRKKRASATIAESRQSKARYR